MKLNSELGNSKSKEQTKQALGGVVGRQWSQTGETDRAMGLLNNDGVTA